MALKAGRVGLNKELVDEFGNLKEDVPSGEYYTKTQADNKFETKTHVNNNFQKKTLEVPIELLSGSALTVESALQGLNEEKQNITLEVPIELLSGSALTVESALQGLNEEKFDRAEQRVLGAKNLLVYPYRNTTKTDNGITFTDNGDGSITVSGTATAQATFDFDNQAQNSLLRLAGKSLLMTGGNSSVLFRFINPNVTIDQSTSEQKLSFTSADLSNWYSLRLVVQNGTAISTPITIYPMLRLASDPDDTYVPYAMTNKEITDDLAVNEDAVTTTFTVADGVNYVKKIGRIVQIDLKLSGVTAESSDTLFTIPEGFRPSVNTMTYLARSSNGLLPIVIYTNGVAQALASLSSTNCQIHIMYLI